MLPSITLYNLGVLGKSRRNGIKTQANYGNTGEQKERTHETERKTRGLYHKYVPSYLLHKYRAQGTPLQPQRETKDGENDGQDGGNTTKGTGAKTAENEEKR